MLNDLTSSIGSISSAELDKLWAEVPDDVVNVDSLNDVTVKKDTKIPTLHNNSSDFNLPKIDLGGDDDDEEVEDAEVVEEKVTNDEVKQEEKSEETIEDKKESDDGEKSEEDVAAINSVLKNTVEYLIKKGVFQDFEGREEMDIDPETYAELAEKQIEAKLEQGFKDKVESTGEYGQAIIDHIENGGDPDEIIDLFKEKKEIQQIELSDEDSQKSLITKWYKEQHGWSDARIKKTIDNLLSESDEALEAEAEEIKSKYDDVHKRQLAEIKERQDAYVENQKKVKVQFEQNITKAIDSQSFDDKRKRLLKDSIFKFKQTEDGRKINDFAIKFAEWQSDPAKYIELAEFVLDKEGYLKRQNTVVKNEAVEKAFNFVKGGAALSKNKGSKHTQTESKSKSNGVDFSVLLRK